MHAIQLHYYKLTVYKPFNNKHTKSMLKVHHPENERFVTFQFNMLCSTMLLIAIEYSFTARFRTKYGLVLPKLLSLLT